MTALALGFLALATSAAAGSPGSAKLTLDGPSATRFGHVVDFTGRLTPAAPGKRVELLRGQTFVAATAV